MLLTAEQRSNEERKKELIKQFLRVNTLLTLKNKGIPMIPSIGRCAQPGILCYIISLVVGSFHKLRQRHLYKGSHSATAKG